MERDDLIVNDSYSVAANHSEEAGKKIRKKILFVTILLSVITAVEVLMGAFIKQSSDIWPVIKVTFVMMTLVKAAYIVLVFMHLGDERKNFRAVILYPYLGFIMYFIYLGLTEGNYQQNFPFPGAKNETFIVLGYLVAVTALLVVFGRLFFKSRKQAH